MTQTWNESEREAVLIEPTEADVGKRLDAYVAEQTDLSRSAAVKLIENGDVTVGGKAESKNYRLREGDTVEIVFPLPEVCEAQPQDIPLDIVYEDEDLIVINKPCGMVVHPAPGNPDGTLVNALLYHCKDSLSGIGGVIRPGIVHRIDKDTSGLLVVAKNDAAHLYLAEQLKGHHIQRVYYAIALGNLKEACGTVDAPIGRHPIDRKKMAVIRNAEYRSREAITHWTALAHGEADGQSFTLVRCELETGRTHQIRVHLSSIGHPLLGDTLYGGGNTRFESHHKGWLQGQALHAGELMFVHPESKETVHFQCPLPENMQKTVQYIFGEDALRGIPNEISVTV